MRKRIVTVAAATGVLLIVGCTDQRDAEPSVQPGTVETSTSYAPPSREAQAAQRDAAAEAAERARQRQEQHRAAEGTVLEGFTMNPSPAGYTYRDNGISGTAGQRITSYSFGTTEPGRSFVVAVHRGPDLAASLASERYRPSAQSSARGRVLYEAEVVISKELAWAESDDVIAFVTSADLGFTELAAIADTVDVDV